MPSNYFTRPVLSVPSVPASLCYATLFIDACRVCTGVAQETNSPILTESEFLNAHIERKDEAPFLKAGIE